MSALKEIAVAEDLTVLRSCRLVSLGGEHGVTALYANPQCRVQFESAHILQAAPIVFPRLVANALRQDSH